MKETLKDVFSNVNDWLKFAEAKNAALIAFNLGSIFGAATIITQTNTTITILQEILDSLYLSIILNCLGLIIALYSFWPRTQRTFENLGDRNNVLYYGHIRDCKPESYLTKLSNCCKKEEGKEYSKLELDYVSQIIVNSIIASKKYSCFKTALIFTLFAILIPIIFILCIPFKTINCLL